MALEPLFGSYVVSVTHAVAALAEVWVHSHDPVGLKSPPASVVIVGCEPQDSPMIIVPNVNGL